MSIEAYSMHSFAYEEYDLDVYFEYNNTVVFSTHEEIGDKLSQKKGSELIVITKYRVDEYESVADYSRYCREDILCIQGIITFFTGFPLTVYNINKSSASIEPIPYKKNTNYLKIDDVDYSSDLNRMLEKIDDESNFIITLLDRWRKAIYLKEESCEADLFYDEATLSFFHILELFGDCVNRELRENLDRNIEGLLANYFKAFYFSDKVINEKVLENKKNISSILVGEYLSLAVKIKYFLEKYKMLDDNVAFFVDSMIKVRNAIAHGRIAYQNKFIWPLSPFFNMAKNSYENIDFLFFMTAKMISSYIGITCWDNEWEEEKKYLLPHKSILDSFLDDKLLINDFCEEMLFDGNKYNITWRTIFNHYIRDPKRSLIDKIEIKLKKYFIKTEMNEDTAPDLFNISLVFSDSYDEDIKNKAISNIKLAILKQWHGWPNFKDAYSYLDFYNVNLKWYKSFLDNHEYLGLKC